MNTSEISVPIHPLFDALRKLDLTSGDYAVFGSGPMWARGIREGKDIDIIARGNAWVWATEHGAVGIKEGSGLEYVSFADGGIEVYHAWYPGEWDIDRLIETAEVVEGVPFVRLEYVVEWKKVMGREKDKNDLVLVDEYLSKNKEVV